MVDTHSTVHHIITKPVYETIKFLCLNSGAVSIIKCVHLKRFAFKSISTSFNSKLREAAKKFLH